jgi:2-polyprenyl-6-methoxyphenol hydroxylase-like FAD-dependent oxidoreductase
VWLAQHVPEEPLVIAGAGIAGLALSAALQRHGIDSVVVEERPAVFSAGGGITLWPNALAALDSIGLGDEVRAAGTQVTTGSLRTASGRVLLALTPERVERALGGPLVAVRRGALLDVLQEHVAPGSIRTGVAVRGYRRTESGVSVELSDGARLAARSLVGADGYRSEVARALGGPLTERYSGYTAWRAIAPATGLAPVELVGGRQEFGVVPLGEHGTYWFATLHEAADSTAPEGELAHLRAAFAGWPEPVGTLLDGTDEGAVNRVDIVDRDSPARWQDGPVVVIGDAAHAMRPHLGQGGCQALVDAAVLAPLLARSAPVDAFAEYVAARRRTALRVVTRSRQAGQAVNARVPLHRLMPLVPDPLVLRRLAAVAGAPAFRP